MKNFFLFSLLILCFLSIFFNYTSINSSKWRHVEVKELDGQTFRSSFGFWKMCNETFGIGTSNLTSTCQKIVFRHEPILSNSRAINYIGYVFQMIGTFSIFVLFFIAFFEYKLTLIWNLNVILSIICVSFFTVGQILMILSTILFISKAKFIKKNDELNFYEPSFRSFALIGFILSILCTIGVLALNFIFLSTSTLKRTKKAANDSVEDPKSTINKIKKSSSQKNFRLVSQPMFPKIPPPPPPPLSVEAKTSFHAIKDEK